MIESPLEIGRQMIEWLSTLERPFAFLLSMPLLVALAAFVSKMVSDALRRKRRPLNGS
jgi:hypothetical protein